MAEPPVTSGVPWQTHVMAILLVRHADAGSRSSWDGPDRDRPLTSAGRAQAVALAAILRSHTPKRLLSSPYARCIQTLEPLGVAVGLEVELEPALGEGRAFEALERVRSLAGSGAALCTHGDVIPEVLQALAAEDGLDLGPYPRQAKASTWILESAGERFISAAYIEAPR